MALGVPREEAESGPNAHAITRWLGADAPTPARGRSSRTLDGPGWLLLCSDGLWNYCSEAADLAALVHRAAGGAGQPRRRRGPLADGPASPGPSSRVARDNISVALARVG